MSLASIFQHYQKGQKIACLTAYDASFAKTMQQAGVDLILVGDSLGMLLQGYRDTLAVTMQQMIYHTACVRRGAQEAVVMSDMPFLSCSSRQDAITNAGKLLAEGGADLIKIEGGRHNAEIVAAVVEEFIPVCGHVGLRPQQVRQLGGFFRQGKTKAEQKAIYEDAMSLVNAGCCMLLLECVETEFARELTQQLAVPTIGIGSGKYCSGQILVCYDVLGIGDLKPWFSKNFLLEQTSIEAAFTNYVSQVKQQQFPS